MRVVDLDTGALSAPFILANSAVGMVGVLFVGRLPSPHFWLYAAAALGGAMVGTAIGLRWLNQTATRFALTGILLAAGIQLAFFRQSKRSGRPTNPRRQPVPHADVRKKVDSSHWTLPTGLLRWQQR